MMFLHNGQTKLDFSDVLILPKESNISSRSLVDLNSKVLLDRLKIHTNGIIAANMDGVGTIDMAIELKKHGCMTALHKHHDIDELLDFFADDSLSSHSFYSMGITQNDFDKLKSFAQSYKFLNPMPLKICIDVANGYMKAFADFCLSIRKILPESIIMAGNVVDYSGAEKLNSVDIIKIGIGQGSNCLTRTQTGIGYPQFSAVYDFKEAPDNNFLLCSDGGCTTPADICKAMGAGASMVMLGGMLAGTKQGGGDIIDINGNQFVEFYGMSSATAQKKHNGGLKDYRSSEGRTTVIPYKGDVNSIIQNILGGLRSACTYVGAESIDDLKNQCTFMRVNSVINNSMERFTVGM